MRNNLQQPIYIKLEQSSLLMGLISIVSIVSCLIILNIPIEIWVQVLLLILIVVTSTYFVLRDALRLLPWSWQTMQVNSGGELMLTNKRGLQFKPALAASCFIHEYLIILNFSRDGFKLALAPVILLNLNLNLNLSLNQVNFNQDAIRQLRVWLRWFKHHNVLKTQQPEITIG